MEEVLISKKELLLLTDISYGQLYRWKRKNLVPEDWFIHKSTFTGQETFFPKEKILSRIDKIKDMKDGLSLDELADMFSSAPTEINLKKEELVERNIVSKITFDYFIQPQIDTEIFSFEQILIFHLIEKLLQTGEMSLDEGKSLLQTFEEHYKKLEGKSCELILVRKMGVSVFLLISSPGEVYFESGVRVVIRLNLANCIEELKIKIT